MHIYEFLKNLVLEKGFEKRKAFFTWGDLGVGIGCYLSGGQPSLIQVSVPEPGNASYLEQVSLVDPF